MYDMCVYTDRVIVFEMKFCCFKMKVVGKEWNNPGWQPSNERCQKAATSELRAPFFEEEGYVFYIIYIYKYTYIIQKN